MEIAEEKREGEKRERTRDGGNIFIVGGGRKEERKLGTLQFLYVQNVGAKGLAPV